jgi:hypothetical protein
MEGTPIVLSLDEIAVDPRPTPFCKALIAKVRQLECRK